MDDLCGTMVGVLIGLIAGAAIGATLGGASIHGRHRGTSVVDSEWHVGTSAMRNSFHVGQRSDTTNTESGEAYRDKASAPEGDDVGEGGSLPKPSSG